MPKWKYLATTKGEESERKITAVGVDLAKQVFAVHGVDRHGKVMIKKTLRREQTMAFFSKRHPGVVAMEACGSSHYWARRLTGLGHATELIAPQFVKPYGKGNKHDPADAAAICEAASRPSMRFVTVNSPQSQAVLGLHRVRDGFIKARTAQANQLRGLLAECGLVVPRGMARLLKDVTASLPTTATTCQNGCGIRHSACCRTCWNGIGRCRKSTTRYASCRGNQAYAGAWSQCQESAR